MRPQRLEDLNKLTAKRCTMLLDPAHKVYLEELAFMNDCLQRDALFHVIEFYRSQYPIDVRGKYEGHTNKNRVGK